MTLCKQDQNIILQLIVTLTQRWEETQMLLCFVFEAIASWILPLKYSPVKNRTAKHYM